MKIIIKATGFPLTPSLKQFINNKVGSLSRFVKRFEGKSEAEARCEVGRTTRHHHKGNVFRAEVNVALPGKILRAVEQDEDIHTAITKMKDTMRVELRRHKDKLLARRHSKKIR